MLLFKPANALGWFITVWKLWAILPRKMHHPLKLCKNFFKVTFIKPNSIWNWQTQSRPANQYLMACASQEAWGIFRRLISKVTLRITHLQMLASHAPQKGGSLGVSIWMVFIEVSPEVAPGMFTPIWWGKDEKGVLGDKRLWKTLFWEFLHWGLCGLQR